MLSVDKCYILDVTLADTVARSLPAGSSVSDLGAGLGCYTRFFMARGINVTVALDFARNISEYTHGRVHAWDLSVPYSFPPPDWSFSIETAEHIPSDGTDGFLSNVANARCGAILSWAPPGQHGKGHINLRQVKQVERLMASRGLRMHAEYTDRLSRGATLSYLKRNVHVYVNASRLVDGCTWQ